MLVCSTVEFQKLLRIKFYFCEIFTVIALQDWVGWGIFAVIPGCHGERTVTVRQPAPRGTPRIAGLAPVRIIHREKLQDRALFRNNSMESQTQASKQAPRESQKWRVQGNLPTLCQPFANLSPTLCQPFLPMRNHLLSKNVFLCFKKMFRREKRLLRTLRKPSTNQFSF